MENRSPLTFRNLMKMPGVKASLIAFFTYCALETTIGLWTSTYLTETKGTELVMATKCGMLFYIGISSGRFISGMISERLGDRKLINIGIALTIISLGAMLIPETEGIMLYSLIILAGIGCGPVYPSMLHQSPEICGTDGSQMLIGFQLAMASAGSITIPALFGIIVNSISVSVMP